MGNFASSALCPRDGVIAIEPVKLRTHKVRIAAPTTSVASLVDAFKTAISGFYHDLVGSLSGSSVVLSQVDEAWYQDLLGEIDTVKARCARTAAADCDAHQTIFLGPSDTVVASIDALSLAAHTTKAWNKSAPHDDDDTLSCTTDETDDESKCDYSDSEASEYGDDDDDHHHYETIDESYCCAASQLEDIEYYSEDDDTETKADRLLRLASVSSNDITTVYVEDYLCPCGECPQYERIACDVRATVTWRGVKEQTSIIRVLQAFSTYNEVIGYHPDMIEAAEECLQMWLGDEDRALNSLVMLYDEVPQLCAGEM